MQSKTHQYQAEVHYWPRTYHPVLGAGPTTAGLIEEIGKAEARGRVVRLACHSHRNLKVTVYIPR